MGIASQFDATRKMPETIPKAERHRYSIKDLQLGGFIEYGGKTWFVQECGKYDELDEDTSIPSGDFWHELKLYCLETGQIMSVEWEEDDVIEISVSTQSLAFRDLSDDGGEKIDSDDLDQIVDDEDVIMVAGKEFRYDDDYSAMYHRSDDSDGEKVYFYDFEAGDGTCLTIEEWSGGKKDSDYDIWLSESVDPDDIEILFTGG